jgi:hypothetical protein
MIGELWITQDLEGNICGIIGVLSWHFLGVTKENHKNLIQESVCPGKDFNKAPTKPTSWTVRWSNPGGGKIFSTHPDQPWGLPSLLYNGYQGHSRR